MAPPLKETGAAAEAVDKVPITGNRHGAYAPENNRDIEDGYEPETPRNRQKKRARAAWKIAALEDERDQRTTQRD